LSYAAWSLKHMSALPVVTSSGIERDGWIVT
jgi:hypothetical protein